MTYKTKRPARTVILAGRHDLIVSERPYGIPPPAIPAMRFLPSVPGVPDVQAQTLETAVSEAVLGRLEPDAALREAADRATQLLQANLEKFGR